MPTVPTLNNSVRPQAAPNIQRQPLRSTVGESLGRGLGEAGNLLVQIQQQEKQKADRAAVVGAQTQLNTIQNKLLYDPVDGALTKQGQNAFDLPGQVLPELDKSISQITQGLKNERQKTVFGEMVAESRTQIMRDLNQHEFRQREKYYDDSDQALVLSSIQSAAHHAGDRKAIETQLQTQRAVIAGLGKRKGWDANQIAQENAQFESKTHEAVIGSMLIQGAYADAGHYLAENSNRMLDEQVETLQRRLIIEEHQQYERQQKRLKSLGDSATKEGDKLLAEGNLSSAWIEAHRNVLDPSDYRYFYQKLSGGGEEGSKPRDISLYADLRDRAGRGEDVRVDAKAALQRGAIRYSDFDRIVGEAEQQRPGWYSRGSEYITSMSGASLLNPDPAAPQLKASMLDQWGDWARLHPNVTDREAQSAYQDIVSHNMLVQRAGLPLPRLLIGGRFSPDLVATVKKTMAAHEKGEMNDADYAREMEVLQRWKHTLEAEQAQVAP